MATSGCRRHNDARQPPSPRGATSYVTAVSPNHARAIDYYLRYLPLTLDFDEPKNLHHAIPADC